MQRKCIVNSIEKTRATKSLQKKTRFLVKSFDVMENWGQIDFLLNSIIESILDLLSNKIAIYF